LVETFFYCSPSFYICVAHSHSLPCATAEHDVCQKRCQTTLQSWTGAWDTLYVSGHLGVDPAVGKAPDDPEEEARQVLHSVELTLKEAGISMDDLVYVEIYCTDLKLYGAFNKAYASAFKSPYPARDFIGVKDLLFGAHFEVMGIAVRNALQNKRQPLAAK
jgi:2-iminobutanoate/2-iminopropanoate deaminase